MLGPRHVDRSMKLNLIHVHSPISSRFETFRLKFVESVNFFSFNNHKCLYYFLKMSFKKNKGKVLKENITNWCLWKVSNTDIKKLRLHKTIKNNKIGSMRKEYIKNSNVANQPVVHFWVRTILWSLQSFPWGITVSKSLNYN